VHPEWTAEDDAAGHDWGPEVSSYAIDDGERLLLIDPTTPPSPVDELAAGRETVIVLTCPWHERDARKLAGRFGAAVYSPPWNLPREGQLPAQAFAAGDRLPVGVQAFRGMEPNDLLLWIESHRALAAGDTLFDRGEGLEIWWPPPDGVIAEQVLAGLRPLLGLPVELVLLTHGSPTDRPALERALA
jgi:glyoxylase-like metal-dependent hydrolase (beta-lactamase superfamily II)